MATRTTASGASRTTAPTPPRGVWHVDATASTLEFRSRGMFGLVPVRGTFGDYEGTLTVDEQGARGVLRIAAASLDTGNEKRDAHLRSDDFFAVETHPTVTFSLAGIGVETLTGVLQIRDTKLEITAPITIVEASPTRLQLRTDVAVDRTAAGVGWSKLGMIQGKAHLHAHIALDRAA
jgi:polyisoprenoid-binding protein YceI